DIDAEMVAIAGAIIRPRTGNFDPSTYRDRYQEALQCGRSALPTDCASPASRASSEGGEMLTFAHIPTGTTVNKAIDVDDSKSRGVAPATAHNDRSRHRNRRGYTLRSGSGCLTNGVHLTDRLGDATLRRT